MNNQWLDISGQVTYFSDLDNQYKNVDSLLKNKIVFQSEQKLSPLFDDTKYWSRFTLTNQTNLTTTSYLTLGFQSFNVLKVYARDDENTELITELTHQSGYFERPFDDALLIVPITLNANETKDIYLYYQIIGNVPIYLKLHSKESLAKTQKQSDVVNFILIGFVAAIFLMVALHGILNKNLVYFYYSGLMISFMFLISDLAGYNLKYLWPQGGLIAEKSVAVIFIFIPIFHLAFIRQFLNLKDKHKKLDFVILLFILANFLILLLTPFYTLIHVSMLTGVLVIPVLSYVVYWSYNLGVNNTKVFSISLFSHLLLVNFLTLFTVATGNVFLDIELPNLLKVAYTLESIFFAFALAIQNKDLQSNSLILIRKQAQEREELLKLEQEFKLSAEKNYIMKKQSIDKKSMLADISHELRTPLTVMKIEIETLQNDFSNDIQTSYKSLINKIDDLDCLISDLSQISQSDATELEFNFENINLNRFVETVELELKSFVLSKNLSWQSYIVLTDNIISFIDTAKLRQLLLNLVNNSIKYTDVPGCIELNVKVANSQLNIVINDTPPGVEQQELQRIFDYFYRVENSRSRETGGSGLGLSICKNIVDAHNGEIYAQKSPSGGLSICINLPITPN